MQSLKEETINLQTLHSAEGVKWYINCGFNKEKVEEKAKEEALLPGWCVKYNIYCILYGQHRGTGYGV